MATVLDMVGAFLLGTLLLLTAARLNLYISGTQQQSTFDLKAQQMCVHTGEILENDFYRIGNRLKSGVTPFKYASADSIGFYGDVDNNGSVDTVTYTTGAKLVSANARQRMLYRKVNNSSRMAMDVGLTSFKLAYYDAAGVPTATLASIAAIKISMEVESDARSQTAGGSDSVYNVVHWNQFIVPAKLHR